MPQYTLSAPEARIIVSWLFEAEGYLDVAINTADVSARQALQAVPNLDVTVWIRNSTPKLGTDPDDWNGCAMVWWIWKHSNVNVTPPNRPPETATWLTLLQKWDDSINRAFGRVPQNQRDSNTVPITTEDGSMSTMPSGSHLASQQNIINKVRSVLS